MARIISMVAAAFILSSCGGTSSSNDGGGGTAEGATGATGETGVTGDTGATGSTGPSGQDIDSPLVTGGTYYRSCDHGSDNTYVANCTNPDYLATVSDFRLDRYEITVGRFREFVSAMKGTQANPPALGAGGRTLNGTANQGGWDAAWNTNLTANSAALKAVITTCGANGTWTATPDANENKPMNCITWYEAFAFCVWDGGYLPTEAEWNYAATGGSEQRPYPWSTSSSDLTIGDAYAAYHGPTPATSAQDVDSKSPLGDGKWGQADLAGNLWEWVLDYYDTYPTPCNNCATLTGSHRVFRGGGFYDDGSALRAALRGDVHGPADRGYGLGARCARMP